MCVENAFSMAKILMSNAERLPNYRVVDLLNATWRFETDVLVPSFTSPTVQLCIILHVQPLQ